MKVAFDTNTKSFNRKLLTVILMASAVWAVWYLHEVILMVFLSIIIAVGISIPAKKFTRLGFSTNLATTASVLLTAALFFGITLWLIPLLADELQNFVLALPDLLMQLQLQYSGSGLGEIINSLVLSPGQSGEVSAVGSVSEFWTKFVDNSLPVVFSSAGILVSVVANMFLVFVVAIMLLINPKSYVAALLYTVPRRTHDRILKVANRLYDTIQAWLTSLSFSILFTSIAVFIGMTLVGVPNPAAIALFAAMATFVPNIGAIIPLIPIALFATGESFQLFLVAAIVYLIIQLVESNVVTPAVVKTQLDIPVAGILIFQLIAGVLFGLLGVILAVPLLASVIVVVKELVAEDHYGYQAGELKLDSDRKNHLYLK